MSDLTRIAGVVLGGVWSLVRSIPRRVHGLALIFGYLGLTLLAYAQFERGCLWIGSLVRHSNVRALASFPRSQESPAKQGKAADFDGDGVDDELRVEYERIEPLFNRVTSGMVYLESGKTGLVIFSHRVGAPILQGGWVDDYDGDGLTDVVLRGRHGWTIYGFDGDQR